jgi:hypothetical protein
MFIHPYLGGSKFMTEMIYVKGMSRDVPFRKPPLSTEQILHPEKYTTENRDDPTSVELAKRPALMKDGWSESPLRNTFGEFQIKLIMDVFNGLAEGARIAAGWDGDTYAFYNKKNEFFTECRTTWDTVLDASEFYDAMLDVMRRRSTKPIYFVSWGEPENSKPKELKIEDVFNVIGKPYKKNGSEDIINGANWHFVIARRGKDVYTAIFTPEALKQVKK